MKLFVYIISAIFLTTLVFGGNVVVMDGELDYVELHDPIINDAPFTVEAWAIMFGPGGGVYAENTIFEQRNTTTVAGGSAIVLHAKNDESNETAFVVRDSQNMMSSVRRHRMEYGEWHHYAGVVDSAYVYLYLDGILADKQPYEQNGNFTKDVEHTSIGRHAYYDFVAGTFNGMIDEMRIWDYARSEAEIQGGMNRTIDLNSDEASHLLAYWRFDDFYEFWKEGEQYVGVKDLSGNGHHGAFVDDAWLKPADAQPRIVPLVDFNLLSPDDGEIVHTDSPMLMWQSATTESHLLNSELRYTVYIDHGPAFDNAQELTAYGNQTQVQAQNLVDGTTYYWKVKARNAAGEEKWGSSVGRFQVSVAASVPVQIPAQFVLWQNSPNPFNPSTTIQFYAPFAVQGSLTIYDLLGRRVAMLVNGSLSPGMNTFYWDGTDENGDTVGAGLYLCRLDVFLHVGGRRTIIRKMTLLK